MTREEALTQFRQASGLLDTVDPGISERIDDHPSDDSIRSVLVETGVSFHVGPGEDRFVSVRLGDGGMVKVGDFELSPDDAIVMGRTLVCAGYLRKEGEG